MATKTTPPTIAEKFAELSETDPDAAIETIYEQHGTVDIDDPEMYVFSDGSLYDTEDGATWTAEEWKTFKVEIDAA